MNCLDNEIREVVFKIDNDDLGVILYALNYWGQNKKANSVEEKMYVFSLRKLRQKMEVRLIQTKGSLKYFKMRIEPIQAYAMINLFNFFMDKIENTVYAYEVCRKYRDEFHVKLLGI